MGRKLNVTLGIALLMLVFASVARADSIESPFGPLIIPSGSQVTSTFTSPGIFGSLVYGVNFQFTDGTGFDEDGFIQSDGGITFTVPVTNLSFSGILGTGGECDLGTSSGPLVNVFPCGNFDFTLSGPITGIGWFAESPGYSGIESLSFTVDAGDPPTSSLVLLGVGLIGLLVSSRRKVPSDCEADPLRPRWNLI
jgi:hypothetical protein